MVIFHFLIGILLYPGVYTYQYSGNAHLIMMCLIACKFYIQSVNKYLTLVSDMHPEVLRVKCFESPKSKWSDRCLAI